MMSARFSVQRDDVLVSVGVLADQADIVAQSVHGHVSACHGKGFEEVDLFELLMVNVPGLFTSPMTEIL